MAETKLSLVIESDLEKKIVLLLSAKGPMTRDDLCRELGYEQHKISYYSRNQAFRTSTQQSSPQRITHIEYHSRTTVYDTLSGLMNKNVVDKHPVHDGKQGHPKVVFTLKNGIITG